MTITIDATVGGASSNSYISESEFNTYVSERLHVPASVTAAQAVAGTDTIKRALLTATRYLDELIDWDGEAADPDTPQALQWPREDLTDDMGEDLDDDVIPKRLKNATAELAIYLIESDRTAELSSEGISRIAVGSIDITFNTGSPPKRKVIPDVVWQMVSLWGSKIGTGSIMQTLERS